MSFVLKPFSRDYFSLGNRSNFNEENLMGGLELETPRARSGHRIVCDDTNMYSFGGYNPLLLEMYPELDESGELDWQVELPLFRELWKYNISKKSWTKLVVEDIPDMLASNAMLMSGQILMVYGGTSVPFGLKSSNKLYICDLRNESLKFVIVEASGKLPQPMYGQSILMINNYFYTIGGTNGFQYSCDIHRLNIRDGIWEEVYVKKDDDFGPPGRYRHETAYAGNKIFVLGGGTAYSAFDFEKVHAFNLLKRKWELISSKPDPNSHQPYPTPRRCHSSVQLDQYVYILGGCNDGHIFKDIWRLNLESMQWQEMPFTLLVETFFHSSCVTPSGKLISFGGIVPLNIPENNIRVSTLQTSWICIPKLRDICWEALLFYGKRNKLQEQNYLNLGLPKNYIQMLEIKS